LATGCGCGVVGGAGGVLLQLASSSAAATHPPKRWPTQLVTQFFTMVPARQPLGPGWSLLKAPTFMALLILEAFGALVIFIVIVWWTMFSGRHKGELPREPGSDDAGTGSQEKNK
jgi:hypothetical protein